MEQKEQSRNTFTVITIDFAQVQRKCNEESSKRGYVNDPGHKGRCTKSSKLLVVKNIHVKIINNFKPGNVVLKM